ncbi:L,D-transpeptidase family protein [Chitinophaga sp.]|uniref:L,D-transpeptidase family protein n=1 Tax=Chitinophaga sp. TaxID=1869181 RepID=UPI0031D845CE
MKKALIFSVFAIVLIAGCKFRTDHNSSGDSAAQYVTPRNNDITPANAYNSLFLDTKDVEQFITNQKLDTNLANRLRSFYNARNFEYAWLDTSGLNEQAYGFRSLYDYSVDTSETNKALEYRLNALMNNEQDSTTNIVKTELQLTQRFITYFLNAHKDDKDAVKIMEHYVPMQKYDVLQLADIVTSGKGYHSTDIHNMYGDLTKELEKYTAIAKKGSWDTIPVDKKKKYKKGDTSAVIAAIKHRLQVTGELAGQDTTGVFDDALEAAVNQFEGTHGHTPKGIITDTLIREMNAPAVTIVEKLLINMERMRWIPPLPQGRLIMVNIPEFMLHAWNGKNKDFDMAVVVGKEGKGTTSFSGDLNQVVFSPYWNLPRSIIKEEVLPAIRRNPNYLSSHHMEVTGERNGVPVIRQVPGKDNPLGRVKFLFPNNFNIYFHDTNQKELFNKDQRAYSHGCIRLADPVKMANYLLHDQPEWTAEKIDSAMNSGKEKYVRVKHPVPVMITYYTTWIGADGQLHVVEDIYDHDRKMAAKLFTVRQL